MFFVCLSYICLKVAHLVGFPGGTSGKVPACQHRRHKRHESDHWVRKMPWRRTWQANPLQYSCLENLIDRGAWRATVHGGHKESDMTEQLSTQAAHLYYFSRKGTWCFPDRQLAYNPALQTKEHSKSGESMTQRFTNKPQSYQFKFRIFTGFTMFYPLWFLVSVDPLGSDVYVCLVKTMVFPVVMYGCESWTLKKAESEELMLLNCGVGEDSWEVLGLQGDPTSPS